MLATFASWHGTHVRMVGPALPSRDLLIGWAAAMLLSTLYP
jgi:hypothetical protein